MSVQAKRYGPNTPLDSNKVIADFISAHNAANHRLDVYVVAVTREVAQLRADLEPCERQTGVDIVVLADEGDTPGLSALCEVFWSKVKSFFPTVPADLANWIEGAAGNVVSQEVVHRTTAKVSEGLNTFVDLRELGRRRIAKVFRPAEPDRTNAGVHI